MLFSAPQYRYRCHEVTEIKLLEIHYTYYVVFQAEGLLKTLRLGGRGHLAWGEGTWLGQRERRAPPGLPYTSTVEKPYK